MKKRYKWKISVRTYEEKFCQIKKKTKFLLDLSQPAEATLECTRRPCPISAITAVPVPAKLRDLLVEERGEGPPVTVEEIRRTEMQAGKSSCSAVRVRHGRPRENGAPLHNGSWVREVMARWRQRELQRVKLERKIYRPSRIFEEVRRADLLIRVQKLSN
ncbi:unnamed protein product [Caenorhabditis auriculariae]|uniref:Uncharacterized protein n=1 Tax=Caenorhabditis auriculariae TaxID=2777116 RepID=A0A8S1HQE0_9PELO|nr:unnamed protein product [Caenorhabditis auriculariae]